MKRRDQQGAIGEIIKAIEKEQKKMAKEAQMQVLDEKKGIKAELEEKGLKGQRMKSVE